MKVLLLGVDINRSSCDPNMYFEEGSQRHFETQYLDKTAQRIAAFTADVRDDCQAVAWTLQNVLTAEGEEPEQLSPEERAFHRVTPIENKDTFLPKTQMSPYPEHEAYFESLKDEGIDTVVVTGFYASKCVGWTIRSLLDNGFKVIVPTDLIADDQHRHPLSTLDDFMHEVYHGQLIFTDSERVADMILTDESMRTPPVATYTWNDLNAMHYGPGA